MFENIKGGQRYPSFELLADDLRRGYKQAHPEQTEDEYGFSVHTNPDGKSGFARASRVENKDDETIVLSTTLLIENNTVVGRIRNEEARSFWIP
jgi:hypothetical protein